MMPVTEQPRSAARGRLFLRWMQRFLFVAGALAVSYVALTMLSAKIYQEAANKTLDREIRTQERQEVSLTSVDTKEGAVLGRIEIPRLGVGVAILDGTTAETLRHGVGHIAGTALPGAPGNIGIAGHRDTYFRALKDIRAGDEIQIQTATGLSRYEVDSTQIVRPDDVGVLASSAESAITLVTCYPFYFVGSAPQRFIVHARSSELK